MEILRLGVTERRPFLIVSPDEVRAEYAEARAAEKARMAVEMGKIGASTDTNMPDAGSIPFQVEQRRSDMSPVKRIRF